MGLGDYFQKNKLKINETIKNIWAYDYNKPAISEFKCSELSKSA
jgi:hypothetical protein